MFKSYLCTFSHFSWRSSGFDGSIIKGSACTHRRLGPYGHWWGKNPRLRIPTSLPQAEVSNSSRFLGLGGTRARAQPCSGPVRRAEGGGAHGARARRPGLWAPPLSGSRGAEDRTERGKSGGRCCRRRRGLSPEGKWRIWRSSCLMRRRCV